jgi:hypothetical protein
MKIKVSTPILIMTNRVNEVQLFPVRKSIVRDRVFQFFVWNLRNINPTIDDGSDNNEKLHVRAGTTNLCHDDLRFHRESPRKTITCSSTHSKRVGNSIFLN